MKKYKSCIHIQNSVYLSPHEIRACCQRFFVDEKIKGDVALLALDEPRDINFVEVINAKEKLVKDINSGEDDRCSGCILLEEKDWPKISEEKINVISIENHSLCNMKCTYCSDTYYGGVKPQYSLDFLFKTMPKVSEDLHIAWGGGEPTIRKDFSDLFSFATSKFKPKTQRVFTNALKYSSRLQRALDNRETSITTSIDAGTEETFLKIRDSKGLDKVLKFLERYSKNSPDLVTVKYIFTLDNYDAENISQFVEKVKKYNLTKCNFLISADFKFSELNNDVVMAIISMYFRLYFDGIHTVSFDDHVFHKVRAIGRDVSSYLSAISFDEKQDKILIKIMDFIKKKERNNIVVWGTGEFSKFLFKTMDQSKENNQANVIAVIDGMENKWGNDFMSYEIKSPEFLATNNYYIVIASVNFYGEIFNNIVSKGISKERIIPNFIL
jgi:poly(ribitol-phosphate) beta-N-acetylglucosaminyltransferase